MSKSIFKWLMRAWLTLASVGALAAGWVAFSHSEKPGASAAANTVSASSASVSGEGEFAPLPTLAPLPDGSSQSVRPLPRQSFQQPSFQQNFRTRGS